MRRLKILTLSSFLLLSLFGCSSAPTGDQKILATLSDANKTFPNDSWLHVKVNYKNTDQVLLVIRKGGCGYVESLAMTTCYKENVLTFGLIKIYSSPLWRDGFIYHMAKGDVTIKQMPTSQAAENLW
jgi:hypothetical protein